MTLLRWLTVAWIALTLIGLGLPGASLPDAPAAHFDKLAHAFIFAVGTLLALAAWPSRPWVVIGLLVLFAPLTEVWQAMLPTGREAEALDVVANLVGIGIGWLGARLVLRVRR